MLPLSVGGEPLICRYNHGLLSGMDIELYCILYSLDGGDLKLHFLSIGEGKNASTPVLSKS